MARARRLNVMLCRESVTTFAGPLREDVEVQEVALRDDLPFDAKLFVQLDRSNRPLWLDFLQDGADGALPPVANVSNAAVVVVRRPDEDGVIRVFAVPFGQGRHLIDDEAYVRDFGLKIVLNTIDPDQLVSVDVHTLEELPFHRRVQATRAAVPAEFELDSYRDNLTSVTGRPADRESLRMSGTDAAMVTRHIQFEELGELCDEYLAAYHLDRYKERFGWIDQLGRVREPWRQETLDAYLVRALNELRGNGHAPGVNITMASPEILDWSELEGFWITGTGRRRENLLEFPDLDWYLEGLPEDTELTVDHLKRHKLEAWRSVDEGHRDRWSVYRSLVTEIEDDAELHVLINGTWFQVAESLVAEVDDRIDALPPPAVELPPAHLGEHEKDYNERACQGRADLVNLDRKLIRAGPTEGPVEACDLLHETGAFIHVKRYRSGSASLSHLFAQGTVAGHAFLREPAFRDDLRATLSELPDPPAWAARIAPEATPVAAEHEVAFAIIASGWPLGGRSLPFLAKLTLMRAAIDLQRLGYRVTLTRIPIAAI